MASPPRYGARRHYTRTVEGANRAKEADHGAILFAEVEIHQVASMEGNAGVARPKCGAHPSIEIHPLAGVVGLQVGQVFARPASDIEQVIGGCSLVLAYQAREFERPRVRSS